MRLALAFISIIAVFATHLALTAAAAPSPTPSPSSAGPRSVPAPAPAPTTVAACEALIKEWIVHHNTARRALNECKFAEFNTECLKSAQSRGKVVATDSPCAAIPKIRERKFEEINCTIVKVPAQCGDK